MEVNEENFKTLAQYLQQTLSPDQNIRRPGKLNHFVRYFFFHSQITFFIRSIEHLTFHCCFFFTSHSFCFYSGKISRKR